MRLFIQILLALAGGCLILGALQCFLSAIRPKRPPVPWHVRGEERP